MFLNAGIRCEDIERVLFEALSASALEGHEDIVELLLRHGANVNYPSSLARPPIVSAVYSGNTNILRMIIQHGADVDSTTVEGITPLLAAVGEGNAEMVEILLSYGESVSVPLPCVCHADTAPTFCRCGHVEGISK